MGKTRVKSLKVSYFRRFQDIELEFGESITIIAGQNATAKSTLLGMLAQPFSFGVIHGGAARKPDAYIFYSNFHV